MVSAVARAVVKPFSTLLVSTRGEIACRVIRTAKRLGLRTVAVYSDADAGSLHVRSADAACHIGGPSPADSYLHIARILDAAEASGAGAVHPGYGFLSENADFAQACSERGLVFVGPPADVIRMMGSKSAARQCVSDVGVPIIPGYHQSDQSDAAFCGAAENIGYPVMVKPVMGGGGKGMYVVHSSQDMVAALAAARHQAKSSFGSDALLLEKYIALSRHVEVQIFGDWHGNVFHVYERDCSVQRRHQKIIEEAPAPLLDPGMRSEMHAAAVATAKQVGYVGAGTVEFIVDTSHEVTPERPAHPFYFLEMNTRLQVEHPVTEAISGVDLVQWQLDVAAGKPIPVASQADIKCSGHAMEARIYAESPEIGFMPQTGTFRAFDFKSDTVPTHLGSTSLRVDAGVEAPHDSVSVYYDPLIAKVISSGPDRESTRQRLSHALTTSTSFGLRTNIDFCARIVNAEEFANGGFDTGMLSRNEGALLRSRANVDESAAVAALALLFRDADKLQILGQQMMIFERRRLAGFRVNFSPSFKVKLQAGLDDREWVIALERNGNELSYTSCVSDEADILEPSKCTMHIANVSTRGWGGAVTDFVLASSSIPSEREHATVTIDEDDILVHRSVFDRFPGDLNARFRIVDEVVDEVCGSLSEDGGLMSSSPMPGRIVRLLVREGDVVSKGDVLFEVEAMKMMHSVTAGADGSVLKVNAVSGDLVDTDAIVVELKSSTVAQNSAPVS
jgi:3-methylcrotonyl-CoA carboxylase alpha subunit